MRSFDMEKTLIILKPDAFERAKVGATLQRFEEAGFRLLAAKMSLLDKTKLREHYAHIADKPFFPEVETFMGSRAVLIVVLEGVDVVARVRNLAGVTDSRKAAAGTIRGDWGTDVMRNIIHASDGPEAAAAEIARFFRPEELFA
jgi:nucleoside-diphosphate kinase